MPESAVRRADPSAARGLQQSYADCYTYSDGYRDPYGDSYSNTHRYRYATAHAYTKISADAETAPDATPAVLI